MFELLQQNTTNVLASNKSISGVTIKPGFIKDVQFLLESPARNIEVRYDIQFYVESGVSTGGSIKVEFPASYTTALKAGSCGVQNGLTPASGNTVTCSITSRTVTWSNFKKIEPTELQLYVTATNPNASQSG